MSRSRNLLLTCLFVLLGRMFAVEKPWIEVDSPHFRVLSDGSEHDARRVAREFEQMRAVLAGQFPTYRLESGAPLLVLAARDENTAKKLAPEFWKAKGAKPAGYFQHGWEKQFAMVRLDTIASDAYQVVYHEYVHTVLHTNFRWLPVWLDEGMAEFYGNTRFEQGKIYIGAPSSHYGYLQHKRLIPIDTLLAIDERSPYYHDEDKVHIFYGEAWALVHFLTFGLNMTTGEPNKLTQFNNLLQQGTEQKKAFQQVFGDSAELQKNLDQYLHRLTLTAAVLKSPPKIDEKDFLVHTLSMAESEGELGSYHLWSRQFSDARAYIQLALKDNPKLGLAHEEMGFLDFAEGKDEDAAREFAQAYELDPNLYLSLFYKTMLSPIAKSDASADQASFREALLQTVSLNHQFAPGWVELALLNIHQLKYSDALDMARRAEQLEPARAGYHILSGEILRRLGREKEAAAFARFVAERWPGADHNEAVELWNSLGEEYRTGGDPLTESAPKDTLSIDGHVTAVKCGEKGVQPELSLTRDGNSFAFRAKDQFSAGFSDTIWYGEDHFSLCHHLEGMRAVIRYKAAPDSAYAGDAVEIDIRDELPPLATRTASTGAKQ